MLMVILWRQFCILIVRDFLSAAWAAIYSGNWRNGTYRISGRPPRVLAVCLTDVCTALIPGHYSVPFWAVVDFEIDLYP